jgi:DNA repair protein RecN (Recombination protein N)
LLRSLYIKNYALIEEFTVTFDAGLNIITGETGAGKSIVLGAFGLLIGDRASSEIVRHGADKTIVEAEFDITGNPRLSKYLQEREIECTDNSMFIRREVSARGNSRGFVNDSPASTQILKELGDFLVDLHGQHEHQSLLKAEHHIEMLDDFGGLGPAVEVYQSVRSQWLKLEREIEELKSREAKLAEERDLYQFQFDEIAAVDPRPNEDIEIENELQVLENAEELRDTASELHVRLYEEEGSVFEKLGRAAEQLEHVRKFDNTLEEPMREAKSALAIVDELSKWLHDYSDRIELDPERLQSLRDRAQQLQRLKKKYGGTLDTVLERRNGLENKLSFSEAFEQAIATKQKEAAAFRVELDRKALTLSKSRHELARTLGPQIITELKELGIEHASFNVEISSSETTGPRGIDTVEFYISANAGESPKPLVRVASGGEISRIMLALKSVLAKNDRLPLLVFDEIDIGISGRVAQKVGHAMKRLAADHQIISVTHLAQIAAFADAHYLAEKQTIKGTTASRLRQLTAAEHAEEVARLISGDTVSESSLDNARVLIEEAKTEMTPREAKRHKSKATTI